MLGWSGICCASDFVFSASGRMVVQPTCLLQNFGECEMRRFVDQIAP